jgi:pimeloyl-ACP methyl ester carboxylesterase
VNGVRLAYDDIARGRPFCSFTASCSTARCGVIRSSRSRVATDRDRPDSTALLQSIANLPTLLLIGSDDTRTPHVSMQAIADRIQDATFEVISNGGHVAPLERPGETMRRLRRFLNGLKAPAP